MMGFFDKVKNAFGSKKEDVESRNNVNDEVIDEPTFTESIENEKNQSDDSEEIPANEETDKSTLNEKFRNFRYLDDLIHSGAKEMVLDSDIVLDNGEELQYLEGIRLDVDDLTIDGNGHTIDARRLTRIFSCTGKNVTIKNIILKNGFTEDYGGAIYNRGELTIIESTLAGNTASYAGAILNEGGELTITDSTLTGNTAKNEGGAISNVGGELTITDSTLTGNTAHEEFGRCGGGAIQNWKGELTITDSTLTGNTAKRTGGAIENKAKLTISESTLTGNTAKYDGGAISNDGGELTITDSTLTGNTAKYDGGAISNVGGELTITDSTLTGNTAKNDGGAIQNWKGELTITDSTLTGNTAKNDGGAIHNKSELTITSSTLTENTAKNDGGAIHNNYGNFKIFNCEFINNKSPNNIILNKGSLQIYNTIFKDNQSKFVVLNDSDESNLGIFHGEFKENNVGESVICNIGKFCVVEKTIFQDNISNNTMNIINKSELTLTNPKIKDKRKSILNQNYILIKRSSPEIEKKIYGKGTIEIYEKLMPQGENFDFGYLDKKIQESNNHKIILDHDITFENYESEFYEGGLELGIDDLIINGNGHIIDGADKSRIFIITGKNITLKNIIFKNGHTHKNYDNPINNNGGAIKINHNSNITIENCEFINNTSEENGGAIHNKNELTITDSTLTGNTAQTEGGAIQNSKGELTITDSTLRENTANEGGAIQNSKGELTITDSTLTGNTANEGGAIHNEGKLAIIGSTLNENSTKQWSGGAIHNNSELTIIESTLAGNTASYAGAISNAGGELTITDSTLTGNTANEGGAIHNEGKLTSGAIHNGGKLTITGSTLTGNTAKYDGGAIYLDKNSKKYESNNCTFEDNKPDDVYEEK